MATFRRSVLRSLCGQSFYQGGNVLAPKKTSTHSIRSQTPDVVPGLIGANANPFQVQWIGPFGVLGLYHPTENGAFLPETDRPIDRRNRFGTPSWKASSSIDLLQAVNIFVLWRRRESAA